MINMDADLGCEFLMAPLSEGKDRSSEPALPSALAWRDRTEISQCRTVVKSSSSMIPASASHSLKFTRLAIASVNAK